MRQGLEGRVRQLEDEIGRHRERARHSEARRAMESEGFLADITLLRKRIANLERRLLQVRRGGGLMRRLHVSRPCAWFGMPRR